MEEIKYAPYEDYIKRMKSLGYSHIKDVLIINDVSIEKNRILIKTSSGKFVAIRGNCQPPYMNGYKIMFRLFDSNFNEPGENVNVKIVYSNEVDSSSVNVGRLNTVYKDFSKIGFKFELGIELKRQSILTFEVMDKDFEIDKNKSLILIPCDIFQRRTKK